MKFRWPAKRFLIPLVLALIAIGLRFLPGQSSNLSYLFIAAYALCGRAQAIQALALSWLVTMINPGLAPEASMGAIGRYIIMFAAAISVLTRSRFISSGNISLPSMLTLALGVFIIIHSFLVSPILDVSILKSISWVIVMTTVFGAWVGLSAAEQHDITELLFRGFVGVLIFSTPLLLLPQGYLRNGTGFQGLLNHPQAFGTSIALLGAWATGRLLDERRLSWSLLGIAALCVVMVVLSEARTAGLAMLSGVVVTVVIFILVAGKRATTLLPSLKTTSFQLVFFCAVVGAIFFSHEIVSVFTAFIAKSDPSQMVGLIQAYSLSRGALIDAMISNFREAPWTGIGFGVASNSLLMSVERDPLFGLPVAASIEKGVMPLAVLEELGILGFVLVVSWLSVLLKICTQGGVAPLCVFVTILLTNLGESVFFSPGGMGLLQLNLLGWAVSTGVISKRYRGSSS